MNIAREALYSSLAGRSEALAFRTAAGPVTRSDLRQATLGVASGLRQLGIGSGSKVLLRMTNSTEFATAFLGAIWAGAVPVLQNSQFARRELEHIAALSEPAIVLYANESNEDSLMRLLPKAVHAVVTSRGIHLRPDKPLGDPAQASEPFDAAADEMAFIVFTSGTSGKPKGVVHAHRWLRALGDSNRDRLPPKTGDVVLATGEWSFISALGHNVLFPLRNGMTGSVMEDRASPERILATIERDKVTLLHSVATLYRRILAIPNIEHRFDPSSLRGANSTGEPLEASVRDEWLRRFGCPIWEHYGISEAQMVLGDGPETPRRNGSVGKSWGARPKILGPDDEGLATGDVGTLAFDATYPGFFLEYLGDEQRTKQTLRNGWFVTSDLARIDDDGYVYILGRSDDCFKSKGVLIVPSEIEEAVLALGAFEEACVFGVPDAEIGYRIGIAVVPRPGTPRHLFDQAGMGQVLAQSIAAFKRPHFVMVLEELPKNANGKTQRTEVARMFRNQQSDGDMPTGVGGTLGPAAI